MHPFADGKTQNHCFCITLLKITPFLTQDWAFYIYLSGPGENLYHHRSFITQSYYYCLRLYLKFLHHCYVYEFFFSPLPKCLDPQHPSTKHTKKRN